MKFNDVVTNKNERFSIGTEELSGKNYVSIPVSNGLVDYEEYYEISKDKYECYLVDPLAALSFVEQCRNRGHDDLLLIQPGKKRGGAM